MFGFSIPPVSRNAEEVPIHLPPIEEVRYYHLFKEATRCPSRFAACSNFAALDVRIVPVQ